MIVDIPVSDIRIGMVLGKRVKTPLGTDLIPGGKSLTDNDIRVIRRARVKKVSVLMDDPDSDPMDVSDTKQIFVEAIEESVNRVIFTTKEDVERQAELLAKVVYDSPKSEIYLHFINKLMSFSSTVFAHSINVALISYELATWLNMSPRDKENVLLAGLVHDVGKLRIPLSILDKEGKLTKQEMSMIKKHCIYGQKILKEAGIEDDISIVALNHHERFNGSGYPMGLKGGNITRYGSIIAIVDTFEAMTANRAYRRAMQPFTVTAIMTSNNGTDYDPKYLSEFLYNVLSNYVGKKVVLTNGKVAEISAINQSNLSLPVVRYGRSWVRAWA